MGQSAYLYNDWVKELDAAYVSATEEDADFLVENICDEELSLVYRSVAKVGVKIRIDLGSAKLPKIFYLGNHNFTGGAFDINSYTANDWATGKTTLETQAVRLKDVYHYELPGAARQYWEFDLTNVNCTTHAFLSVGRIMLYSDYTLLTEIEDEERERGYEFRNIVNETPFGVRWVHRMTEKRETFGLKWSIRNQATSLLPGELKTLMDTTYGSAYPFMYIPDVSLDDCYYVRMEADSLNWLEHHASEYVGGLKIVLKECVRGKL
jgi:hypothetical protein